MLWTVQLDGAPRRVNHAAVLLGDNNIYSFGGYCSNENPPRNAPIDIHVLNTTTYQWHRVLSHQEVQEGRRAVGRDGDIELGNVMDNAQEMEFGDDVDSEEDEDEMMEGREEDNDNDNDNDRESDSDDDMGGVPRRMLVEDDDDDEDLDDDKTGADSQVPYHRYGHTVVAYEGRAYLWGGRNDDNGASDALHCFDPLTHRWTEVRATGRSPPARDGHSALVYKGRMIIFGGFEEDQQRFSQDTFEFDFATNTWTELMTIGDKPMWRDFHTACVLNDKMYVFGGRSDQMGPYHSTRDTYDSSLRVLDLKKYEWSFVKANGTIPSGRRSHSAFTYKGRMFIFGGFLGTSKCHFNDMYSFDPTTAKWEKHIPYGIGPCERRRQCTVVCGDRLFLFGGTRPTPNAGPANISTPGLSDLSDLFVLDLNPTLYRLAARAVIDSNVYKRYIYAIPKEIREDLCNMTGKTATGLNGVRSRGA